MKSNKIVYAGRVLLDLTNDTVTEDKLAEGVVAHNAKGEQITGTMKPITMTDDGSGNVIISGVVDDGNGNITVTGFPVTASE